MTCRLFRSVPVFNRLTRKVQPVGRISTDKFPLCLLFMLALQLFEDNDMFQILHLLSRIRASYQLPSEKSVQSIPGFLELMKSVLMEDI